MADSRRRRGNLHQALLGLIIAFSAFVIYILVGGWSRLLVEWIPSPIQRGIIALVVAFLVIFLARVLGEVHAARKEADDDHVPFSNILLIAMYFTMFFLSAFGTVNSLFFRFEGSTVLRESLDEAQRELTGLSATARTMLLDPEQERRRAAVERLLASLEEEINHPQGGSACGVGPNATAIINELAGILPGFRMVSQRGVGRVCDRQQAETVSQSYRNQAMRILANDPDYVGSGGPRKEAYLAMLASGVADVSDRLTLANSALARGIGGFDDVQTVLEAANTFYSGQRRELVALAPAANQQLPLRLEIDAARGLGSFSHVLSIIVERRNRISTWLYVVVAFVFDMLLVGLFWQHALTGRGRGSPRRSGRTDPQFLWVNASRA